MSLEISIMQAIDALTEPKLNGTFSFQLKKKKKKYKKYLPKRCDLKEDIMTKEDEIKRDPI